MNEHVLGTRTLNIIRLAPVLPLGDPCLKRPRFERTIILTVCNTKVYNMRRTELINIYPYKMYQSLGHKKYIHYRRPRSAYTALIYCYPHGRLVTRIGIIS